MQESIRGGAHAAAEAKRAVVAVEYLQQQLACRAVGIDFWHIHDAQSVVKSHEIHQHQFLSR